jgi:hypothetical protein
MVMGRGSVLGFNAVAMTVDGELEPKAAVAEKAEPQASHLSIAFDVFEARLEPRLAASLGEARPLQGFGLIKVMERHVQLDGDLEWTVFAPSTFTGEKAPDNPLTDFFA